MTSVTTYTLLAIAFTFVSVRNAVPWDDCVPDDNVDKIYVHNISITPLPIRLPGQYNISFDAAVSETINELFIEIEIGWNDTSSGTIEKVFPQGENDTLRIYDGCYMIVKLLFSPSYDDIERDIDVQIDKVFSDTLGYHAGCPLLPGRIFIQNHDINLPFNLIPYNALQKGTYEVKISFNDNIKSVGCTQFSVSYGGQIMNK